MVPPMHVFDLPSTRTDRMVESTSVRHRRRPRYTVVDAPECRSTFWGHRIIVEEPPWETGLPTCFGWWAEEHGDKGIGKAYISFEHEPWDALTPPPGPPGAPLETFMTLGLEDLASWRPVRDLELRPLRGDADWAALFDFNVETRGWQESAAEQSYLRWILQRRRGLVERRRGVQMGAFAAGRLVGAAALLQDGREARYADVAVSPSFRKRGIATAMVGTLARDLRATRPHFPIWINAEAGSQPERIYRRLGFARRTANWCWSMDAPLSEAEILRRWQLLRESAIPVDLWKAHRNHLWGAVCCLRDNGGDVDAATADMRDILERLLVALGEVTTDDSGYHHTLTRGWLAVVGAQMARHPDDSLVEAAIRAQLAFADKRYLLRYWSRDRMMSREARYGWLEPDLAPLDGGEPPAAP